MMVLDLAGGARQDHPQGPRKSAIVTLGRVRWPPGGHARPARKQDATEANDHRYQARAQTHRDQVAIPDRKPGDECKIRRIAYSPALKVPDNHAKQQLSGDETRQGWPDDANSAQNAAKNRLLNLVDGVLAPQSPHAIHQFECIGRDQQNSILGSVGTSLMWVSIPSLPEMIIGEPPS